ncbi:MAG: DUF3800 domain-containing protein [Treponema sp.]|jgi:hypothetical protein|nr:DUF3800 domain-containing protein [Treponema sp.]
MSWLLFIDESGHDHKQCPYEVRGGVALHSTRLWSFVQSMRKLELQAFGCQISSFGSEIKGSTLLDRKRFTFANQDAKMDDRTRQRHAKSFLEKTHMRRPASKLTREEFTAYGQACLYMAKGIFQVLSDHDAKVFASVIPADSTNFSNSDKEKFFRKDHVFLLERYFYMLEKQSEDGLLVMDEVEKQLDRRFVERMHRYFTHTSNGQHRSNFVIPSPFFVSSDMTCAIQAADVCIYAINWGYRLAHMDKPVRREIAGEFESLLKKLQFRDTLSRLGGHQIYGIVYVPNPYSPNI